MSNKKTKKRKKKGKREEEGGSRIARERDKERVVVCVLGGGVEGERD